MVAVHPDGRELVISAYDGRVLWAGTDADRVVALSTEYAVVRTAEPDVVLGVSLRTGETVWKQTVHAKAEFALSTCGVLVVDHRPDRLRVWDPSTGAERLSVRTTARVMACAADGLVISSGRSIGLVAWPGRRTVGSVTGGGPGRRRCGGAEVGLAAMSAPAPFSYTPLLPLGPDRTEYRLITDEGIDVVKGPGGRNFLTVDPNVLSLLTAEAMHDIAHFLRRRTWPSCVRSSTTRWRRPTTGSSPLTCCATRTSPPAACCRCARTPAPPSSWASAVGTC